jgi:PAS domain S-box-containing protein
MLLRAGVGWDSNSSVITDRSENSLSAYTLATCQPVVARDFLTELRFKQAEEAIRRGLRSAVSTVVWRGKEPYGVLSVFSGQARRFSSQDKAFVQSIANIISQVVERLASEEALRRSEEYYRSLIENSSDGMLVLDRTGAARFVNDPGFELFGYKVGDPDALDPRKMVHPADLAGVNQSVAAAFKNGVSANECRLRRRDGTWADCEVRGRRIIGPDGEPLAVFSTRDISERKASEKTLVQTQAQLQSRLAQQRAVNELGQYALRATELSPLMQAAVNKMAEVLDVEFCAVLELQPDGKTLALRANVGWTDDVDLPLQVGTDFAGGLRAVVGWTGDSGGLRARNTLQADALRLAGRAQIGARYRDWRTRAPIRSTQRIYHRLAAIYC